jgi:endonuclease/exonuclease/phosphatase family metal-dependent hydrolase
MNYRIHRSIVAASIALAFFARSDFAETITVATYNVEHFANHFDGHRLGKLKEAKDDGPLKEAVEELKKANDEDNWEVATVITAHQFDPDILVIEEGCGQDDLDYFNHRWMHDAYETHIVFPTNTDRDQNLCMLMKPGFKILERRDKYHLEKDTVANVRGEHLFARGPAFCKVQTPGGYTFWVGVTHQKSKSGNSLDVTAWRNREAVRTHAIMKELQAAGPDDVMLLGDMNDEVGEDEYEKDPKSGGDSIANLVGPASDNFVLVTKQLAESKAISFGGYWNPKYRSMIDHVIVTPSMKDQIEDVQIYHGYLAAVASDHYPVFVKLKCDAPAGGAPPVAPAAKPVEKPAAKP